MSCASHRCKTFLHHDVIQPKSLIQDSRFKMQDLSFQFTISSFASNFTSISHWESCCYVFTLSQHPWHSRAKKYRSVCLQCSRTHGSPRLLAQPPSHSSQRLWRCIQFAVKAPFYSSVLIAAPLDISVLHTISKTRARLPQCGYAKI